MAVTLVTYGQPGDPSNNFVGISTGGSGSTLTYAATTTAIPNLRSGPHQVQVSVGSAGHVIIKIDGAQVLDKAVSVPPTALLGFSGATGGLNDVHAVSDLNITY